MHANWTRIFLFGPIYSICLSWFWRMYLTILHSCQDTILFLCLKLFLYSICFCIRTIDLVLHSNDRLIPALDRLISEYDRSTHFCTRSNKSDENCHLTGFSVNLKFSLFFHRFHLTRRYNLAVQWTVHFNINTNQSVNDLQLFPSGYKSIDCTSIQTITDQNEEKKKLLNLDKWIGWKQLIAFNSVQLLRILFWIEVK